MPIKRAAANIINTPPSREAARTLGRDEKKGVAIAATPGRVVRPFEGAPTIRS
jgi:hypothetical protein